MACKVRLYNPEWKSSAITDAELDKKDVHGRRRMVFEILAQETSAAAAELGAAANAVLNAVTTPVKVYVVSSDANDTDGATGDARKVRIIGISCSAVGADLEYSVEEVNLNGTTDVLTSRYYARLIHAYVSDWGSGGHDAKGNIIVEDDNIATTTYLTIAAGANESNGSAIYGIDGMRGRWSLLDLTLRDADVTDITEGAMVRGTVKGENDTLNDDDEFGTLEWQINNYTAHIRVEPEMFSRYMSSLFIFTFYNVTGEAALNFQAYILYEITENS